MSESNFWQHIKDNIGDIGDWDRIESHDTAPGFPDTDFTIGGVDGKIELKFHRGNGVPEIRDTQYRWFRRRAKKGCNCWLFAHFIVHGNNYYCLIRGDRVDRLNELKTVDSWCSMADYFWSHEIDWAQFLHAITLDRGMAINTKKAP